MTPELLMDTNCACCDTEVQIHLGPKVYLHDLLQAIPYDPATLPQDENGRRHLVCLDCLQDARSVIEAGLPYIRPVLRDAKIGVREENLAEGTDLLNAFLENHDWDPAAFLAFCHTSLGPEAWQRGADSDDGHHCVQHLLAHYRVHLERHLAEQARIDEQVRRSRARLGITLLPSPGSAVFEKP